MIVHIIKRGKDWRIVDRNYDLMEHCGFSAYADAVAFATWHGWTVVE
jgi:hypothetical protein